MTKRYILLAFCYCANLVQCFSSTEAKTALASKFVEVTNLKQSVEAVKVQNIELLRKTISAQLDSKNADALTRKVMARAIEKYSNVLNSELSWDSVKQRYVELYSEVYTEEDLRMFIEFFSSEAGQVFVAKMPAVMQKVQSDMVRRMQKQQSMFENIIQDCAIEVQAEEAQSISSKEESAN